MKIIRNIVYMRPSEWRMVIPHLHPDPSIHFDMNLLNYTMTGDETANQAFGGMPPSLITQIENVHPREIARAARHGGNANEEAA